MFTYFRFWLACKFIMLGYGLLDKETYAGITFTSLLDTWSKKLLKHMQEEEKYTTERIESLKKAAQKQKDENEKILNERLIQYENLYKAGKHEN